MKLTKIKKISMSVFFEIKDFAIQLAVFYTFVLLSIRCSALLFGKVLDFGNAEIAVLTLYAASNFTEIKNLKKRIKELEE